MKNILSDIFSLVLAGVVSGLLFSACSMVDIETDNPVLSFRSSIPEIVEVKGAPVSSVNDFFTIGYDGTAQWFPESGAERVVITDVARFYPDYIWEKGSIKTFYAYSANLPGGVSASISNTGVTLMYSVIPQDALLQEDVTLGMYSGNGDNTGTANLMFYHPLAQVEFKMGDMVGVNKIDKIEIDGVYSAGTTELNTSTTITDGIAQFSWTGSGSATVFQTITGDLPDAGDVIGLPFMLIPQILSTQNVTVSVSVTTVSGSVTISKILDSGVFTTGKKTVCTLSLLNTVTSELDYNLAAYTADAGDDIFPTEEPEYVEMKMGSGGTYTRKWATMNLGATTSIASPRVYLHLAR